MQARLLCVFRKSYIVSKSEGYLFLLSLISSQSKMVLLFFTFIWRLLSVQMDSLIKILSSTVSHLLTTATFPSALMIPLGYPSIQIKIQRVTVG